jgi:hypothetical protein
MTNGVTLLIIPYIIEGAMITRLPFNGINAIEA